VRALTSAPLVSEACRPYVPSGGSCSRAPGCAQAPAGMFKPATFSSIADMQRHIVTWGAVATGFYVFKVGACL
jgi:hypothetical protein